MSVERINPESLYNANQFGFSHAARYRSGDVVYLAGQVGWTKDLQVAPGDLAAQTRQALANIKAILDEIRATPEDVLRLRTYVVDHNPSKLEPVLNAINQFYAGAVPAPNTFIGGQSLALPEFLVEIEATVVAPPRP